MGCYQNSVPSDTQENCKGILSISLMGKPEIQIPLECNQLNTVAEDELLYDPAIYLGMRRRGYKRYHSL